ncbi:MAG: acetylglutamate kinase [Calditrichia bacterium]
MKTYRVIKIGGHIINDGPLLHKFLRKISQLNEPFVLVHGGGKIASDISRRMGLEPMLINGRRITNAQTLQITVMAYAGWINKDIVAYLQSLGKNAIGVSGVDGNIITACQRTVSHVNYGFVGDIVKVNPEPIIHLMDIGYIPVIAPITHDLNGQLLNTNADTVASAVAVALAGSGKTELLYCFDRKGVLTNQSNNDTLVPVLSEKEFARFKNENVIAGGMIPKLETALEALRNGVSMVQLIHAEDISFYLRGKHVGTSLTL